MGGAVVDGAAGGEGQARVQPVLLDQPAGAVLEALAARAREPRRGVGGTRRGVGSTGRGTRKRRREEVND